MTGVGGVVRHQSDGSGSFSHCPSSLDFGVIRFIFLAIYILDCFVKIVGLGWRSYWADPWNKFDLVLTCSLFIGFLVQVFADHAGLMIILRPFRVLRLLKARKLYQVGTWPFWRFSASSTVVCAFSSPRHFSSGFLHNLGPDVDDIAHSAEDDALRCRHCDCLLSIQVRC